MDAAMRDGLRRLDPPPDRRPSWVVVDVLVAAALVLQIWESLRADFYVDEYGPVRGAAWVLVLAPGALVAVRRFAPATVMYATVALLLLGAIRHGESNTLLAAPLTAYTVAVTRPPRSSAVLLGIAALAASPIVLYGPDGFLPLAVLAVLFVYALSWFVGMRVRRAQVRTASLAAEAAAARAASEAIARQAVADERVRIAGELHDAIGHAVNVIVMQAGAARLSTTDDVAAASLRNIEQVGRSALADLDSMLGLLRSADRRGAPLEPAHGLDDVAGLVEGVRAAGAAVDLRDELSGALDHATERPLGAAVYRVVQEALTNVVKHAGPATVHVALESSPGEVVVRVSDDGRGAAARAAATGGRGIIGLRERVSVLGGSLHAGPRPGGGWSIVARLPRRSGQP